MRALSHKCGWRAQWCCSSTLSTCYVCSNNCLAGDYRLADPFKFTGNSCNVAEDCNDIVTYDCSIDKITRAANTVSKNVNTGT